MRPMDLSYNFERITRHPLLKYDMLFEKEVCLAGLVIQANGLIRLSKNHSRFFIVP